MPVVEKPLEKLWEKALADAPLTLALVIVASLIVWLASTVQFASAADLESLQKDINQKFDVVLLRFDISDSERTVTAINQQISQREADKEDLQTVAAELDPVNDQDAMAIITNRIRSIDAELRDLRTELRTEQEILINHRRQQAALTGSSNGNNQGQ